MSTAVEPTAREPADPNELRAMFARLRAPEDRPLPTEEEADAWQPVADEYYGAVVDHLEPHVGEHGPMMQDTEGPLSIDVAIVEPQGGTRPWGALYTIGAGAAPVPGDDAPGDDAPIRRFELIARLPMSSFGYPEPGFLEPFDELRDAVVEAMGEIARLPHLTGACYAPPQILATPDLSPLVKRLPFAGVLLRDARGSKLGHDLRPADGPEPLDVPGAGLVTFLTVTFLFASETRALLGADREAALARLERAHVDEMADAGRKPAI